MSAGLLATALVRAVLPADALDPDRDEAREWAERELSDPVYDEAQPTPLDRLAQAIGDFIDDLLNPRGDVEWSPVLAIAAIVIAVGLVIAAVLIWGRPRLAHRAGERSALLFGDAETRSAAQLRQAAAAHAAADEWDEAIVVRFRALARGLEERGIVEAPPGTTAQSLARRAQPPFPDHAAGLDAAARAFDDVRYLRRRGTAELYDVVASLDDELVRTTPHRAPGAVLA
ncbi:DUF4129 domain-containing protein [Microbacterium sp. JZ31]|uniref:DUF4129 domain-containing protein n=1 Tax=Microbacterium sp. JZ31 TaxID=1906274 RepID=UPI001932FB02|nr:DUF4129 domain-containing protein [Microbacterium sp. JZ31]